MAEPRRFTTAEVASIKDRAQRVSTAPPLAPIDVDALRRRVLRALFRPVPGRGDGSHVDPRPGTIIECSTRPGTGAPDHAHGR